MTRRATSAWPYDVVKPYCDKHGLTIDKPTFWEANVEVWNTLKASAKAAKLSPAFVHAINLEG